jgi:hypothetical protein
LNAAGDFHIAATADALIDALSTTISVSYPGTTLLSSRTDDPWDLTITGTTLVWSESGFIVKLQTSGSGQQELASFSKSIAPLAVKTDGTDVFFINSNGTLQKVPLAGGTVSTLVTDIGDPRPTLEVSGGFVYFADAGQLRRVASNSATVAVSATTPLYSLVPNTSQLSRSFTLKADGSALLFTTSSGLSSGPVAGGAVTLLSADQAASVVVSGTTLYYLTTGGALKSIPVGGGPAATIASTLPTNHGRLVTDGANVYVGFSSGAARVQIGSGSVDFPTSHDIWGLALDGSNNLFWARFNSNSSVQTEIYRAPK